MNKVIDAVGLLERLRSSAKAFRDHPIYTQDGDGGYLTVQADEMDEAVAALIVAQERERVFREIVEAFVDIEQGTDSTGFDPSVEQMLMDLATEARAALSQVLHQNGEVGE